MNFSNSREIQGTCCSSPVIRFSLSFFCFLRTSPRIFPSDRRNCNNAGNIGIEFAREARSLGGERGKSRRRRRQEGEKAKHLDGLGRGLIVQGWPRELLACKVIVFDAVILQCRACTHASQPRAADTSRRSVVITAPVLFLLPSPSSLLSLFRRRLANRDSYPPDPRHPSAKSTRAKNTPLSRVFETRRRFLERTRHPSSSRARLKKYPPLSLEEKEEEEREREKRSHRGRSCTARRKESGSSRLVRPNEIEAKILERDRIDVATDDNRNRIFADSSSAACVRSEKRRRAERRFHEYDRRHGGTPVFHRRISRARSVHDGVRAEIHPTLGTRVPSTPGPLHLAPSLLFGRRNTASRENGGSRPDARVDARGRYV